MNNLDKDTYTLLQAFKANGSLSFESLSVADNRALYENNTGSRLQKEVVTSIDDLSVTTADGNNITIRIYDPRTATLDNERSEAIIFIHGGGWVVGSLATHDSICRFVANRTNKPLIAIDYRLAPEHPFPCALNDCLDVLAFIEQKQHALKINPKSLIIMGDSAGGNLATVIAHQFNDQVSYKIIAETLFYPVTSLVTDNNSYDRIATGYPLSANTMHWFIEKYLAQHTDRTNPKLSPLYNNNIKQDLKSFIVTVGLDPLCDEGVNYAQKLITHGNYVEFHHLPNTIHGIITSAGSIKLGKTYLIKACDFITKALG